MKKLAKTLAIPVCIFIIFVAGCTPAPSQPEPPQPPATISPGNTTEPVPPAGPVPSTPPESAPSGPVKARLAMSSSPLLDKPVQLTATFTVSQYAQKDIQDLDVEFILPEGFQLVEGSLKGKVQVLPDTPAQYQATIKAIKTGIWEIQATALYPFPVFVGGIGHAHGYLYATISENSAEVSDMPPKSNGIPSPSPAPPPPGYEGPPPVPPTPRTGPEPPYQPLPPDKVPTPSTKPVSRKSLLFNDPLPISGGFYCPSRWSDNTERASRPFTALPA